MKFLLLPVPCALRRIMGWACALMLMGQGAAAQKVFYRIGSPTAPLRTAHEVDSLMQAHRGQLAKSGFTLAKRTVRTVTRPDTVIHELALNASNAAVTDSRAKLATFVGKPLPAFALPDLAGRLVSSRSLLGHPVVINMWFTTCAPCVAEMPALNKIRAEQAGSDAVFLAITYEEPRQVRNFLQHHAFTYRHIPSAGTYCRQFTHSFPISLFVDRTGIVRRIDGGMPWENGKASQVNDNEFRAALELITQP